MPRQPLKDVKHQRDKIGSMFLDYNDMANKVEFKVGLTEGRELF